MFLPIILNPASGPERPILRHLNNVFAAQGVAWDIYLTHKLGDAGRLAQELLAQDRVQQTGRIAVCGGDGTLKEVARVLAGTEVAMAILPGGTGNAFAQEVGIPRTIAEAAALASNFTTSRVQTVDMGEVTHAAGSERFILRASLGLETHLLQTANRQLKERLGLWAYPVAALQTLGQLPTVHYQLTLDGKTVEADGVQCTLANSAQMGLSGLILAHGARVNDGLLDVLVLTNADLLTLAEIATTNWLGGDWEMDVLHWQVRSATIVADPPQAVAIGGDVVTHTPITARVIPNVLKVVVP